MGGGGMSIVGLRKLVISTGDDIHHEYLIHGERIADQSVSSIHQSLSSSCGKELTKLPINMWNSGTIHSAKPGKLDNCWSPEMRVCVCVCVYVCGLAV